MSESQEPKTAIEADPHAERLSALLDGELDADQTAAVCAHWRTDPQAQARWHSYSLIGDALRSEELTHQGSARDAAFLNGLRERLAHEPVPIGRAASRPGQPPVDRSSPRPVRAGWTTPIGVAAGVLMVMGLAWTLRPGSDSTAPQAEILAMATAPATALNRSTPAPLAGTLMSTEPADAVVVVSAPPTEPTLTAAVGAVAGPGTDSEPAHAELQPYLHAHRLVAGQSSASLTPAVLRGVSHIPGTR